MQTVEIDLPDFEVLPATDLERNLERCDEIKRLLTVADTPGLNTCLEVVEMIDHLNALLHHCKTLLQGFKP